MKTVRVLSLNQSLIIKLAWGGRIERRIGTRAHKTSFVIRGTFKVLTRHLGSSLSTKMIRDVPFSKIDSVLRSPTWFVNKIVLSL